MENQSLQGLSFVRKPKLFSLILINSPRRRPCQMTWEMPINIKCGSNVMFSIMLNDRPRKFRVPALSGGRVVAATDCQTLMLWKQKQGFSVCMWDPFPSSRLFNRCWGSSEKFFLPPFASNCCFVWQNAQSQQEKKSSRKQLEQPVWHPFASPLSVFRKCHRRQSLA